MTILFVLENYYPHIGGVETLFKLLAEKLAEQDHRVIILTTQLEAEHPRKEELGNITVLRYPFKNRYFFTFFAIFPILRALREVDIVHTTSYNAGLPAFFAAKLCRKKVIITFHEMWGDLWFRMPFMSLVGRRLHHLFEQFLVKLPFDKFVAVSESTADSLRKAGVDSKRLLVNYNGINYDDFEVATEAKRHKNTKFTYTYFGRLGVSKGLNLLLDAAQDLKKILPNTVLQLIIPKSPAPFYKDVLDTIHKNNLTDYIVLRHHLSFEELKTAILQSDCVVIPSYSEGFCFAAVETMALGVPIISSHQTALKEVIGGKHIKMEAMTKEALVRAAQQAKRGEWEETPLRQFHLRDTVQRYVELYQKL